MRRLLLAAAALAAAAAGVLAQEPPAPKPTEAQALFAKAVDGAVARGVAFLRGRQKGDGSFGTTEGETGLALLTLRHCGVDFDDKDCRAAAKRLALDLPSGTVYGDAFGVLGLLVQDPVEHKAVIVKAIDRLVEGQCANGQWSYLARGRERSKAGDNSNTQCALLALGFARERRFEVPAETFRRFNEFAARTRNEDGGYGYGEHQDSASYGSMTAGMISVQALATAGAAGKRLRDTRPLDDPAVQPALRWLGERFDAVKNPRPKPPPPGWGYYWLWSVERAGAVLGTEKFGAHTWYDEGARSLLERQRESGSWVSERELPDTCWALLFLRRSTLQLVTTPSGGAEDPNRGPTTPK